MAWYFGGSDFNTNGFYETGEIRDLRTARDSSLAFNQVGSSTGTTLPAIAWTTEDVDLGYAGKTLRNQRCLDFRQKYVDANGNLADKAYGLAFPITSDPEMTNGNYTVLLRFRLPALSVNAAGAEIDDGSREYMLGLGSDRLRFGVYNEKDCAYCCHKVSNWGRTRSYDGALTDLRHNATNSTERGNVWCELAVVSYTNIYNGSVCPNMRVRLKAAGNTVTTYNNGGRDLVPDLGNVLYLGCSAPSDAVKNCFQGKVHFLGVWKRKLSDAEIAEAFCEMPQATGFSSGTRLVNVTDTYGGDAFGGGTATGDVAFGPDFDSFIGFPAGFADGSSLTLASTVNVFKANAPQVLHVKTRADSAPGTVTASVGETVVGRMALGADDEASLLVPGSLLPQGPLALRLAFTGLPSGGSLKASEITFGGSWQLGLKNKGNTEVEGSMKLDYDVETMAITNTPYYTDGVGKKALKLRFPLAEELAKNYRYTYSFSIWTQTPTTQPTILPSIQVKLNGREIRAAAPAPSGTDVSVAVNPDDLVAGENVIEFNNLAPASTNISGTIQWNWGYIDYHRFTVRKKVAGLVLIVR